LKWGSPLDGAAGRGNIEVIECLLKHGANINLARKVWIGIRGFCILFIYLL
jgi:hypothetical protein